MTNRSDSGKVEDVHHLRAENAMPKDWYDPRSADSVRVIPRPEARPDFVVLRRDRRDRSPARLGECLLYPLIDGPGIGLLVFFPPCLWLLSLPVFDVIAVLQPFTKGDWALGLLVLPVFLPLLFSFTMTVGYVLLVLGQMLVASALGELDHPRWPEWHPNAIAEGLGRWFWSFVFGAALGGLPIYLYWKQCGPIGWFDRVVIALLVIAGVGYAQMALAAALMHDTLLAANPITVLRSIRRVGRRYVLPSVVAGLALVTTFGAFSAVLYQMPSMKVAAVALWAFWVFALYEGMVVMRLLGLTYYTHADRLAWFKRRPKWATPSKFGRLYANS